jgi:peptidyl-prolyl cis-trans isomerase SurA
VRRPLNTLLTGLCLTLAALFAAPHPASTQNAFSPVIRVNDKAITAYEIEQRALLLAALGAPGDLRAEARERLIDERLQVQAAETQGLEVTEEGIQNGITEFAGRANTEPDAFLAVLRNRGVAEESFRDFIEAGVLWREVVRTRFVSRAQVSEDEIDRAVALAGQEGGARVLISEIILPARNAEELARAEGIAADLQGIRSFEAFAAAARQVSASQSRQRGGRVDWLPLSRLPPPLRAQFLTMRPGETTEPLRIPNAVGVFQLRAFEELPPSQPAVVALDYAEFRIPGGSQADARQVAASVDTCDDLYGTAQGLPEDRLLRETRPPAEIPADVARELARLDDDETSIALTRGSTQLVLMLCGRTTETGADIDRSAIRSRLLNDRVRGYGAAFLAELRAEAVIVEVE